MRIGLVLAKVPGFSETFFNSKIRGLLSNNHEVILFVNEKPHKSQDIFKVVYVPNFYGGVLRKTLISAQALLRILFRSPKTALKYIKLERETGSDWYGTVKRLIINSYILESKLDWLHFGYAVMGIERELVGRALGAKVAVSLRGHDILIYPLKYPGCYKRLWRYTDKVHTISDFLLQEAFKLGLSSQCSSVKITPAIDSTLFRIERKAFFIKGIPRIVTVSRLHWIKGLEHTLEALSLIKSQGILFEYVIVGEGSEYEALLFAAHQLGIDKMVNFIGKKSSKEVTEILKSADIYIQYSFEEGFCNSTLEAQASGLLCVVSDAEGLKENVIDGITGWIVPKRNPPQLAQKIIDILNTSQGELLFVSQNAAHRVKLEYDIIKQQREFKDFYEK